MRNTPLKAFAKKEDPNIKDYAKHPQSEKIRVLDTDLYKRNIGTITQTPTRFQKFKQNRKRRQNQLIDLVAPGVPQIKNLVNVTKEKLNKK